MIGAGWFAGFAVIVLAVLAVSVGLVLRTLMVSRQDVRAVLDRYGADMQAQRKMYEDNVLLVRQYQDISSDFKELLLLVGRTMTEVADAIKSNQFCPLIRNNGREPHERQVSAARSAG